MELIIATTNAHKVREIRTLLKPLKILDVFCLLDFPDYVPLPETGSTFEENAIIKAVHAAQTLNKWTIADDSGLVVPAIGGAPGVYSARYAGQSATDKENRKKLLTEMSALEGIQRSAYFECCIALASPQALKKCVRGVCEGLITTAEKGRHGFGYDPIFLKHDYNQTFGELDEAIKNQISHRSKALQKLMLTLESFKDKDS